MISHMKKFKTEYVHTQFDEIMREKDKKSPGN